MLTDSVAAASIFPRTRANQMPLPKFLTNRDIAGLTGADIGLNGGYEQILMFLEFIDHFIHDLQYAVIALRDDPYILDDNHLAGTINLGQLISERIQTRCIVCIEYAAGKPSKFVIETVEDFPGRKYNQSTRTITQHYFKLNVIDDTVATGCRARSCGVTAEPTTCFWELRHKPCFPGRRR